MINKNKNIKYLKDEDALLEKWKLFEIEAT